MKKFFIVPVFIMFALVLQGSVGDPLDPSSNAIVHNKRGMWHSRWGHYYPAIEEYKIAIALNPQSSASSTFYNNLGIVYNQIGKPNWAATCFENAIHLNPNCMYYYENLVDAYFKTGEIDEKEKIYLKKADVFFDESINWLMLGLIQEKKKKTKQAVKSFENYLMLEPKIVLGKAVADKIEKLLRE